MYKLSGVPCCTPSRGMLVLKKLHVGEVAGVFLSVDIKTRNEIGTLFCVTYRYKMVINSLGKSPLLPTVYKTLLKFS